MAGETANAGAEPRPRVFISYSRKNLEVAEALVRDLKANGFEAFLDKHDILPGEPWRERLSKLLVSADTVVFLISPDSIASSICDWEVNEAERLAKRLLPVVVQDVPDEQVPGRLKRLNYVFLRDGDDRAAELAKLGAALRTDIQWIREHTRIAEIATRWDATGRPAAQLFRGDEVSAAEEWARRRPATAPPWAPVILEFIAASRTEADAEQARERVRQRREARRNRIIAWGSLAATAIVSVLGWFFLQSAQQALRSQSQFLADLAQQQAADGDPVTGALLALEGLRDATSPNLLQRFRPYVPQAEFALDRSMRKMRERLVLRGHTAPLEGAAFSPDGRRAVTAGDDSAIVWNTDSGDALLKLGGHKDAVVSAVFSPDGSRILTASSDKTAHVWDAASGKQIASFEVPGIRRATFSPDGKRIVTASFDRSAKVMDIASGAVTLTLQHESWVDSAVFSPNGLRILTSSTSNPSHQSEGIVRLWDAATGAVVTTILAGGRTSLHSAAFSPDGTRIVTAGLDRRARVWDAASGKELLTLEGHSDQIFTAVFSLDGTRILTASQDSSARVWDARTGGLLAILRGHEYWIMGAAFSPDGKRVLTASADRTARIWDTVTINELVSVGPLGLAAVNNGALLMPDGRIVAADADNKGFDVWDSRTGKAMDRLECFLCFPTSASFGAGNGHVVVLTYESNLKDLDTGETLGHLEGASSSANVAVFSPDRRRLLTGANSNTPTLYDVGSGKGILHLDHVCINSAPCAVLAAGFSADGTRIVTGTTDKMIRVWDAKTAKELLRLTAIDEVRAASFSPDGAKVMTAASAYVQLWDAQSGELSAELVGHRNSVRSAVFSRDGSRILTASLDGTAKVWDVASRGELYRFDVGTQGVTNAVFSADGAFVLTTSMDRTARLWSIPLSTGDLITQAKTRAPRCLTSNQRDTFHLAAEMPAWCDDLKKWHEDLVPGRAIAR